MSSEIYAVMVTYNPEIEPLSRVIKSLLGQTDEIIIVDNGSKNINEIEKALEGSQIKLIKLPENKGIATAQNEGIAYADAQHAKYILLMDQDTVMPEGAVLSLYENCKMLEQSGAKIGAIGCAYRDTNSGQINKVWKAEGRKLLKQQINPEKEPIVEVDFVIASGSLIPVSTLKDIGMMEDDLFIDLVDVEWGLRAKFHGYQNYQCFTHIMEHTLGNARQKLPWTSVALHSPIRNYYSIRNSIFLTKRNYIGCAWRQHYSKRIFLYFIVFGFFPGQKWSRIRFMTRGIRDGILSRGGTYRV